MASCLTYLSKLLSLCSRGMHKGVSLDKLRMLRKKETENMSFSFADDVFYVAASLGKVEFDKTVEG